MSEVGPSDELTAAIAAVAMLLAEETDAPMYDTASRAGWRASARLATAHLPPTRPPIRPAWHKVERLRRPPHTEP
jgi:hypothetical protein